MSDTSTSNSHRSLDDLLADPLVQLADMAIAFRDMVATMLARHQTRPDALVAAIRKNAAAHFDVPFHAVAPAAAFQLDEQPYWVTQAWSNILLPSRASLLACVLPGSLRHYGRAAAPSLIAGATERVKQDGAETESSRR